MKKIYSLVILVAMGVMLYFGAEVNAEGTLGYNQNKEIEFMKYAKKNHINKFNNINKYFSVKADMKSKVGKIPEKQIFEVGKNIIITRQEVQLYKKFYDLNSSGENSESAEEYARERNALYVEAMKNGYSVSEEEIQQYLIELKSQLKSCLTEEEYNDICAAYGGEEEYWQYEYEVYQINLPIQNYVKDIEEEYKNKYDEQYSADEIEQMWGNEFERIKEKLVEEQNFS